MPMRRLPRRRLGLAACAGAVAMLIFAVAGGQAAQGQPTAATGSTVSLTGAIVRLPAAPGRPAAGYMDLKGGAKADRLVSATSPLATRIELHRSVVDGAVMKMERMEAIDVPAGGTVRFAPGGLHMMIFGLKPEAAKGVPLTLRFASGATLATTAKAEAPGGSGHDHH